MKIFCASNQSSCDGQLMNVKVFKGKKKFREEFPRKISLNWTINLCLSSCWVSGNVINCSRKTSDMNLKLFSCYSHSKYPKVNVTSKKGVKKSGNKKKKSSSHRHRLKNTYVTSNLFSHNFYPANHFFKDTQKTRSSDNRVGGIGRNGYLISQNTPQIGPWRRYLPANQTIPQQYWPKVGFVCDCHTLDCYFFKFFKKASKDVNHLRNFRNFLLFTKKKHSINHLKHQITKYKKQKISRNCLNISFQTAYEITQSHSIKTIQNCYMVLKNGWLSNSFSILFFFFPSSMQSE